MRGGSSPPSASSPSAQQPTPLSPHHQELVGCLRLNVYARDRVPPPGPELTASVRERCRVCAGNARVKKCLLLLSTCSASRTERRGRPPFTAVSASRLCAFTPFPSPAGATVECPGSVAASCALLSGESLEKFRRGPIHTAPQKDAQTPGLPRGKQTVHVTRPGMSNQSSQHFCRPGPCEE